MTGFADNHINTVSRGGFTILELMVACVVLAVLAGVGIPQFSTLKRSFELLNAKSYLLQDLKRAQAESITQGCRGVFVILPDGSGYTFGCDYLDYDTNDPPSHDVVSLRRNLPAHILISAPEPIIFNSRGQAVDVDGVIANLQIRLEDSSAERNAYSTGTLLGTGVFNFD